MIDKIKKMGLKVTPQRLAIMNLLDGNQSHPSAEQIYKELKPQFPSLSLATVYNTLEALSEGGELQEVRIKRDKRHFDPNAKPHTHFLCHICDNIFDLDLWPVELQVPGEVEQFMVQDCTLYLYGICPQCRAKSKHDETTIEKTIVKKK